MIIFESIFQIIHMIIGLYIWVVIIGALLSWVNPDPHNPIVQVVYKLTDPAYTFIRRYLPSTIKGIDLSPIILLISLQIIDNILLRLIYA